MKIAKVLATVLCLFPALALAEFTLLDADFDDKTVDDPISLGGPDVGEPITVDPPVSAIVRNSPLPSPCLEIAHVLEGSAGAVVFEFMGEASVDVGKVAMSFDISFPENERFRVKVHERGGWASKFCEIYTDTSGNIRLTDAAGYYGVIGSYNLDQVYNFQFLLDTETDTYDVLMDGTPLIEDRAHGLDGVGIGRLAFKIDHTAVVGASFVIDNVFLTADVYTATETRSLSELKTSF